MKNVLIPALFVLISTTTHAQLIIAERYYNNKGQIASESESAFVKVGRRNDQTNTWIDTVRSYFMPSRKIRSIEVYDSKGNTDGKQKYYYESGVLKEESIYRNGKPDSVVTAYYENGKLNYTKEITLEVVQSDIDVIVNYWDSSGTQLVKNGNGNCRCFVSLNEELCRLEGKMIDSLRVGEWKGFRGDTLIYVEQYDKGVVVSGVRYDKGTELKYQKSLVMPEYEGGTKALYGFIGQHVKYPVKTARRGIDGVVYVSFIVQKTGEITDIKIFRSVEETLDAEAERVVRLMSKWNPGAFKGAPIITRYLLPVRFALE